jgi:hypothetical protein
MQNAIFLNYLDTVTNLVFLIVAIAPAYLLTCSLVIGELPFRRSPLVKVSNNGHLKIVTLRNPWTAKWIVTFTLPTPPVHVRYPSPARVTPSFALPRVYRMALRFGIVVIMALGFIACNSPAEPDGRGENGHFNVYNHPKACIESFPVIPDTLIKGLESYTLKVGAGTRNRCRPNVDQVGEAVCKGRNPDTLYFIATYCPATLSARNAMGGD